MSNVKSYAIFLVSLLVAIVVLRLVLKASGKLPVVGKLADKADDIAFD